MRACLFSLLGLLFVVQFSPAFEKGDKVVLSKPAELETITKAKVNIAPGSTFELVLVEGDRLKVSAGRVGWIKATDVIAASQAEDHFTQAIDANAADAQAIFGRGKSRFERGDKEGAIADFDRVLKLAGNSEALALRGFAKKRTGDKEGAIADFDAAIKLNPKESLAWRVRGATWASKGDYEKALADYSESIRVDPENTDSLHHRVIMLSGCQDDRIRNGQQAIKDATKACELSEWRSPLYITGLAYAQAETGDFAAATKTMQQAIELAGPANGKLFEPKLKDFAEKKPLRMTWK